MEGNFGEGNWISYPSPRSATVASTGRSLYEHEEEQVAKVTNPYISETERPLAEMEILAILSRNNLLAAKLCYREQTSRVLPARRQEVNRNTACAY